MRPASDCARACMWRAQEDMAGSMCCTQAASPQVANLLQSQECCSATCAALPHVGSYLRDGACRNACECHGCRVHSKQRDALWGKWPFDRLVGWFGALAMPAELPSTKCVERSGRVR